MRWVWLDGFETTSTPSMTLQRRYGTSGTVAAAAGRKGGASLSRTATGTLVLSPQMTPAVSVDPLVGFGLWFKDANDSRLVYFRRLGSEQAALWLVRESATACRLEVRRGATVLGASDSLPAEAWLFIEIWIRVHDSLGAFELRIDQVPVLEASGIDTKLSGNAGVDSIELHLAVASGGEIRLDDLFILDGATDHDFQGDIATVISHPLAAGFKQEWTPVPTSPDNVDRVNDLDPDDDTAYVRSLSGGHDDLFEVDPLGDRLGGGIAAIALATMARIESSSPPNRSIRSIMKHKEEADVVLDDDTLVLPDLNYHDDVGVRKADAHGNAWERQALDTHEFGYRSA